MTNSDDIIIRGDEIEQIVFVPQRSKKKLIITLKSLEEDIYKMRYLGNNPRYNKVYDEGLERCYLPPFVDSFYNFIFEYLRIPRQEEFWKYYLQHNSEYLKQDIENDKVRVDYMSTHGIFNRTAYIARMLRAYPSLLRDFHFITMLRDDEFFRDKFYYSLSRDYKKIDITIFYKGREIKIGLDIDTRRSNMFREKKQRRHEEIDVHYFSIKLSEGAQIGYSNIPNERFIVYPKSTLQRLRKFIESGA